MVTMVETGYFTAQKGATSCCSFCIQQLLAHVSVTEMISTLNWVTLEKRREKARLCMLYKTINGLIKIPMDHYKSSTFSYIHQVISWSKFATTQL